jgi:hypothetical protein
MKRGLHEQILVRGLRSPVRRPELRRKRLGSLIRSVVLSLMEGVVRADGPVKRAPDEDRVQVRSLRMQPNSLTPASMGKVTISGPNEQQ